jgi:HPt (histidine-containing phosphotransfer) domain-containing protein
MVRSTAAERRRERTHQRTTRRGPIDLVHLAKQTLGDRGLELEVLRMFDVTARAYFARMEESTTVEELLRHLHTLKGAAAGIGAVAIRDLAAAAEQELRAGRPVNPERIDDIEMAVVECSAWIEGLLAREEA